MRLCLRRNFFFLVSLFQAVWLFSAQLPGAAAVDNAAAALSLDDALSLALENNLNLKKNLIDLGGAEYSANRLWSEVFPAITGTGGISYPGAGYSSQLFTGDGFKYEEKAVSYSVGLGISLGLNAGIPFSIKNIRLAYQRNLLDYEDARNLLAIDITKKFFSMITEKNNLVYLEDILKLAERQYEKNQISFNNGLMGEMPLLQSRLGAENARFNLIAARSSYANNTGEFLAMLGLEHGMETILLGEINIVRIEAAADRLINEYLPKRPDIVSRRQEIQRLENVKNQTAFSGRAPSLDFSLNWGSSTFDPEFIDRLSGSAQIRIPIDPWVPGTTKSQAIYKAGLAIDKAKLDLQIAEDSAKTQIRSLVANLRNSWDSVEIARLSLTVAERSYQLTEQGFLKGTVESLVLEDVRNNLANSRQRLLQSELSYFNMTLDLSKSLNMNWKDLVRTYGVQSEKK